VLRLTRDYGSADPGIPGRMATSGTGDSAYTDPALREQVEAEVLAGDEAPRDRVVRYERAHKHRRGVLSLLP
jgi:hypothetical protein